MGYHLRFFRTSPAVYDAARAQLDALYGHPNSTAETCLPPAADWPMQGGLVFVALAEEVAARPEVAAFIAANPGAITEITEAEWVTAAGGEA